MPEQHQATPEQWAVTEKRGRGDYATSSCIVELKRRIEALEAAQRKHIEAKAAEAGARCAVEQMRSRPGSWQPQDKLDRLIEQDRSNAQQLTLVERVADAIGAADDEGLTNMTWSNHSRAAIRAVAEWLRAGAVSDWGLAAADLLDNEALHND
jgi:hypothetical protein